MRKGPESTHSLTNLLESSVRTSTRAWIDVAQTRFLNLKAESYFSFKADLTKTRNTENLQTHLQYLLSRDSFFVNAVILFEMSSIFL